MINETILASVTCLTIAMGGSAVISDSTPITIKFFVGGCVTLTGAAFYLGRMIQKGNDQRDATAKDIHKLQVQMDEMDGVIKKIEQRCYGCVPIESLKDTHQITRVRPSLKDGD